MQVFGGGGGSDDEVRAFVEKDRCEHADCYYSTSSSRSCRTVNGESRCELVRRVLRQCPGERGQREVFSSRSTEEGGGGGGGGGGSGVFDEGSAGAGGIGGGLGDFFFGGGGGSQGGPRALMDPFTMMDEMIGQIFGQPCEGEMHERVQQRQEQMRQQQEQRWQQRQQQQHQQMPPMPPYQGQQRQGCPRQQQEPMPAPHRFPRGHYAPDTRAAERPRRAFDAKDFRGPVEDV